MDSTYTTVAILGVRTPLAFGSRFDVRYGRAMRVLRDVMLVERARNGDLVFENGDGRTRVKPAAIDSIVGSGSVISPRRPDETAGGYLARLERGLGRGQYARWIETPEGQRALEAAAVEDRSSRKGSTILARERERQAEVDRLVEEGVAELGHDPDAVAEYVETELRHRPAAEAGVPVAVEITPRGRKLVAAAAATEKALGVRKVRDGDGWREVPDTHNHIWKCPTCKRRTRKPMCSGVDGARHVAVEAPAGARRESRA